MGRVNLLDTLLDIPTFGGVSSLKHLSEGKVGSAFTDVTGGALGQHVGEAIGGRDAPGIGRQIGSGIGKAALGYGAGAALSGAAPGFGAGAEGAGAAAGASPQFAGGVAEGSAAGAGGPGAGAGGTAGSVGATVPFEAPASAFPTDTLVTDPGTLSSIRAAPTVAAGTSGAGGVAEGLGGVRASPGPTPLTDLSPAGTPAPQEQSSGNLLKAMLALQAMQQARGLAQGGGDVGQVPAGVDPQQALQQARAQQALDQQRAILRSLPRSQADVASAGLSGASPEFLAQYTAQQAGLPDYDALALIQQYLGRA